MSRNFPGRTAIMMFPCSALPPPLYPGLLRPPPALCSPLTRSLPSGFLVEDLLRLSQPVSYVQRTFSSSSPRTILPLSPGLGASPRALGPSTESSVPQSSDQPSTPQAASADSGYLKFGVSAILAPSTRRSECEEQLGDDPAISITIL